MANRRSARNGNGRELRFNIETERETDGRWIAEIADLPGVLAYGRTEARAKANAYALALRVIADRVEKSRTVPESISLICAPA
jgi:predicted RNase H-like HicB family nuclease